QLLCEMPPRRCGSTTDMRFGGVTDVQVKNKLARGRRIRAVLSQPQHAPLRLSDEVALMLALQGGLLDGVSLDDIAKFRLALPSWLDRSASGIVEAIDRTGQLDHADAAELRTALDALVTQFLPAPSGEAAE